MNDREYATPFTILHAVSLLGQKTRLHKFRQAIQRVVKEGHYVVDIGTGSGVLAIFAAKAGAERVTALEINPESLLYAKSAAELNDVEHIIDFFEGSYVDFVPQERADVVICEMLSSMMLIEQQIPASAYAMENILKPGGVLLPEEISVYLVPVECPLLWERFEYEELQFPRVVQTAQENVTRDLANMKMLETFDVQRQSLKGPVDRTLHFRTIEGGTIHGLVGVFESRLYDDIYLHMEDGWKQLFLPLSTPVDLEAGDSFSIRIVYHPGKYDSLSVEVL